MAIDDDANKLFEFYKSNSEVKKYMDEKFSGNEPNPDYLPTLKKLYNRHQASQSKARTSITPSSGAKITKYAAISAAVIVLGYVLL